MSRRNVPVVKPHAKSLLPAGGRSGRGAASVMPYLEHQLASRPKAPQAGNVARRKQRRGN